MQSSVTASGRDRLKLRFIPKAYLLDLYSNLSPLSFFFLFLAHRW